MENKSRKKIGAFTLLEMVAVVTILVILAGVTIPIANGLIEDAKVAKTIDCVRKIADACRRYYADTGRRVVDLNGLWTVPASAEGWNGPYLDRPIENSDNAFEGGISINPVAEDFKLSFTDGKVTKGLALTYSDVPMTAVAKIEEALDDVDNPVGGTVNYLVDMTTNKAKLSFFLMPWSIQ